jgi:hypothetical protein
MPNAIQIINQSREQARRQARDLTGFDFSAPAELFPSRNKKGRGRVTYKRFDTAAEAIRFAVEDMPGSALLGAYLESKEARFGEQEIRALYDSPAYPLERRAVAG